MCIQSTVSLRPPIEHKLFLHVYIGISIVAVSLTTLMINYLSSSIRKESYHPCPSGGLVLEHHTLLSRGHLPIIRYLPQQSPYSPHSALWQVLKSIELYLCPIYKSIWHWFIKVLPFFMRKHSNDRLSPRWHETSLQEGGLYRNWVVSPLILAEELQMKTLMSLLLTFSLLFHLLLVATILKIWPWHQFSCI